MSDKLSGGSKGPLFYSIAVLAILAGIVVFVYKPGTVAEAANNFSFAPVMLQPNATFAADAGSLGAIPDGTSLTVPAYGAPRNVTYTVTGTTGAVTNVSVDFTIGSPIHTFGGDLDVVLIAPNGASHTLFSRTGATASGSFGTSSDVSGPYTFNDAASGTNWWTAAATTPIPSGTYRTTTPGPTTSPAAVTSMNPQFTGVTNANGTWTLRFRDGASGDTGSVAASNLTLTTASTPPPTGKAPVGFNGDGKSDWSVVRNTGSGPTGQPGRAG